MRSTTPADVCYLAFDAALKHVETVKDPCAYICQILKIEEPNYHERRAIARHEARKAEERAERRGARVDEGMVGISGAVGRYMKAKGGGQS